MHLSEIVKKIHIFISDSIARLIKECQRFCSSKGPDFKFRNGQIFFQVIWMWLGDSHSYKFGSQNLRDLSA